MNAEKPINRCAWTPNSREITSKQPLARVAVDSRTLSPMLSTGYSEFP